MLKYLLLMPLTVALFTSCPGNQTTTPVVTSPVVVNLTGVYSEKANFANGDTSEGRIELIDNNGTLTGNVRTEKYNNAVSQRGPFNLNGTRSSDGKKAEFSYVFTPTGKNVTHTLNFDGAGGISATTNIPSYVSSTIVKVN